MANYEVTCNLSTGNGGIIRKGSKFTDKNAPKIILNEARAKATSVIVTHPRAAMVKGPLPEATDVKKKITTTKTAITKAQKALGVHQDALIELGDAGEDESLKKKAAKLEAKIDAFALTVKERGEELESLKADLAALELGEE